MKTLNQFNFFHFQSLIQHISEICNSVCFITITQEQNNKLEKKKIKLI